MTKVLNPVIGRFAGRTHFAMAAQLTHTGRRSGKTYVTPVSARPCGDHMWVALTFGTGSDPATAPVWNCRLLLSGI